MKANIQEIMKKSIAHPLKDKIKKKRITQLRLALALNCKHIQVSRWLNGYDKMPSKVESQIEEILKSIN